MQSEDVFSFHSHGGVRKDFVFKLQAAEIKPPVSVHIRFILKEDDQVIIQDFVNHIEAFNFIRRYDIFDDCYFHSLQDLLNFFCLNNDVA